LTILWLYFECRINKNRGIKYLRKKIKYFKIAKLNTREILYL